MMVRCVLGDHLAEEATCLRKVMGFEKPRREGGANQIVLRQQLDEWACWECVMKRRQGINQMQDGML